MERGHPSLTSLPGSPGCSDLPSVRGCCQLLSLVGGGGCLSFHFPSFFCLHKSVLLPPLKTCGHKSPCPQVSVLHNNHAAALRTPPAPTLPCPSISSVSLAGSWLDVFDSDHKLIQRSLSSLFVGGGGSVVHEHQVGWDLAVVPWKDWFLCCHLQQLFEAATGHLWGCWWWVALLSFMEMSHLWFLAFL